MAVKKALPLNGRGHAPAPGYCIINGISIDQVTGRLLPFVVEMYYDEAHRLDREAAFAKVMELEAASIATRDELTALQTKGPPRIDPAQYADDDAAAAAQTEAEVEADAEFRRVQKKLGHVDTLLQRARAAANAPTMAPNGVSPPITLPPKQMAGAYLAYKTNGYDGLKAYLYGELKQEGLGLFGGEDC